MEDFDKAISEAKRIDRTYEWHDLNENENDLPEREDENSSEFVLIKIKNSNLYLVAFYAYDDESWFGTDCYELKAEVEAWMYIPEFKSN